MKQTTVKFLSSIFILLGIFSLLTFQSCDEDETPAVEDPIASFQFEVDTTDFLKFTFTNYSQNAVSYSWDFGDGETSTEENPVHSYASANTYTVTLIAYNADDASSDFSATIDISDPNEASKLLTGEVSKTWKLYREGTSISLGESIDNPANWWEGLTNDGSRPCLYEQTFTFHADGSYVFDDDMGSFWGEYGVFDDTDYYEVCFDASEDNMINKDGIDVSAWLSGTHAFAYDVPNGMITLTGMGAWMGIPKLGPTGETTIPVASTEFMATITQETGYDLLTIGFDYGDDGYWQAVYVNYSNTDLEPEVVYEEAPWGEDLPDITPNSGDIKVTFASKDAADLAGLDTITSGSVIQFGVDDPTDATATKVGEFTRVAGTQYQELKFQTAPDKKDIQFDNLTKLTMEVYYPSSNDYTGSLTQSFVWGFADASEDKEWWNFIVQKENTDIPLDTWTTYEFDLTDAKTHTDLDMFYIGMGGGGHDDGGTFYVRNLIFE